jgi:predicted metal-dependent HD superfamily phosphohydrolase
MSQQLCNLWRNTLLAIDAPDKLTTAGWQEVEKAYTGRGRHYHNLNHLGQMATLLLPQRNKLQNENAVWMALFFHDIVYKAARKDNEAKSAETAISFLKKANATEDFIETTARLIHATKHHEAAGGDTDFFTDADLGILGATRHDYETYTWQIRKEYYIYPNLLYKPGRRKVVEHFLAMPRIYKTDTFHKQLEVQARENLQWEWDLLRR